MILTLDSDVKPKDIEQSDIIVNRATIPDDPPPAYSKPQPELPPVAGPATVPLAVIPIPDSVKPSNFLSLSRGNTQIKGTYVIDPRIKVPQPLLPPRNLFLHTSNGSIEAEVFIVGDGDHKQKVKMMAKSSNGSVVVKLHTSAARPPINIRAQSSNGSVTIHLPRSFRGPVTVSTRNGAIRFSDALSAELTTFNEVNKTRRCFIGDYSDWTDQPEGWMGDELNLETMNGGIKVQYDAKGKGLFAKLLGV
ncbi:hypothetical protein K438DRAFT_1832622 [Mycena galopus ATCC 62051]|nr:hypothetical protein K438DRAFT_1832622 [Mycena galopus ATCC 62051]